MEYLIKSANTLEALLTLRAPRGGGSKTTPPLGFSSVVFARGMILKRNFG